MNRTATSTAFEKNRTLAFILEKKLWLTLLIPLGLLLSQLAKMNPDLTETFYSQGLYPLLARLIGTLTSLVPVSVAEVLLAGLLVSALVLIVLFGVRLVKAFKKGEGAALLKRTLCNLICNLLVAGSVLYSLFLLCGGLNYSRYEFTYYSGLEIRSSSVQELAALCDELIVTANEQRANVAVDADGVMTLTGTDISRVSEYSAQCFYNLYENHGYDILFPVYIVPKSVLASEIMSMSNITGIFIPFTFEANVNGNIPAYNIPATMCHELAHTRGFMREDEANFIAYLACRESQNADFLYSGTMLALLHSMNRLAGTDPALYSELSAKYSDGVRRDFVSNDQYWKKYEGVVAEVSSKVNDAYLKANSQADGVQSYGRMVDLLLADYRNRHEID